MVGWFEIPVKDMGRAIQFYQDVMDVELSRNQMGPLDMAFFPWKENGPGAAGSLVYHEEYYQPSTDGVLVYLSSKTGDLNDELNKVEAAGGKVLQPKTLIKEDIGYMALFLDSEGNRIAFHSRN